MHSVSTVRTSAGGRTARLAVLAAAALALAAGAWDRGSEVPLAQEVPAVWTHEGLEGFELPPPHRGLEVEHISPDYYYAIAERVVHETYPVYAPGREPPGYLDSLRALGPRTALDTDTIDTDAEWAAAGEMVFRSPQLFFQLQGPFSPAALVRAGIPVAADGTIPFHQYVVLPGGDVRIGAAACSNCHQRVMPDGSLLMAVQGNYPFDRIVSQALAVIREMGGLARPSSPDPITADQYLVVRNREQFHAPWVQHGSQKMLDTLSVDAAIERFASVPPGVLLRQGTNFPYPAKVPDLRGVRDKRFLDATGLFQHRSIGDLMRYAASAQFVDQLNRYGDFVPSLGRHPGPLPHAASVMSPVNGPYTRFTDAQAYALARYLYSLEPLPSPHAFDEETLELGEQVFIAEGCVTCHTPPLYTNNHLTPALGFEPPEEHYDRYPIFDVSVETDPGLALYTRRSTGYYKVPSLRGLWYRERLFHDGSLSLEQVFDSARLEDDFVPAGFHGTDATRAVPGHPFGLELAAREKEALIAYLLML